MRIQYLLVSLIMQLVTLRHLAAQDQPTNQPEKFIFYEVVLTDSLPDGLLYHNALVWAKSHATTIHVADSLKGIIRAENIFTVYKESGVLKKVSGKVGYDFMVEVKANRYRYHFNNFIFHYYGPDRYYNIIATGKKKKLEDAEAKGWQKLWSDHREKTTEKAAQEIATLKAKIIEQPVVAPATTPAAKKEVKWD